MLDDVSIRYSVINDEEIEIHLVPKGREGPSYVSLIGTESSTEHLITKSAQALIALRAARAQTQLAKGVEVQ